MTPTQDLILELLAARYRLGEQAWTFDSRHSGVADQLGALGLVWWKRSVVEKTILIGLTEKGRAEALGDDYVSPVKKLQAECDARGLEIENLRRNEKAAAFWDQIVTTVCRGAAWAAWCAFYEADERGATDPVMVDFLAAAAAAFGPAVGDPR